MNLPPLGESLQSYQPANGLGAQPYRLWRPLRPRRRYPLVLCLHGFGGRMADWDVAARRWADALGVVLAGPDGWGNQHFDGLGEDDVLATLADVAQRLPLDPDRIYLHGGSMGGHGALRLGLRHPHRFAAVSAVAGWISGEQWYAKWYAAPGEWQPPAAIAHLVEAASPWAWREQARYVAGRLAFGTADGVNEPEDTEWLLAWLAQQGLLGPGGWQAERVAGGGHGAGGRFPEVLRFLLRHRRRWPRRMLSPTLRHADLGWVRVDGRRDPTAPVDLRLDWSAGRLAIDCPQATELHVRPGQGPPELRRGNLALTVNGADWGRIDAADTATISLAGAPTLPKRRGTDGGPGELFRGAFRVLAPSQGNDRAAAQAFLADWRAWFHQRGDDLVGHPPALADEPGDRGHLVVWGGLAEQPWLTRWADWPGKLGVRPTADGLLVEGRAFAATRYGWQVLHPLPWQPDRLVLLCHGYQRSPEAAETAEGKDLESLPWRAPDVVVFDPRIEPRLSVQPPLRVLSDAWVLAGTFDAAWQHLLSAVT